MTRKSNKYILLILSLVYFSLQVYGNVREEALTDFLKQKGIVPSSVAVKIIDLSDGSIIVSHNDTTPLIPASIMKSVTTASLLKKVGPDYRYHTRVYMDGPIELGYLRGNLIIEGSGDPTINSEKAPYTPDLVGEIIDILKQKRINRIEGGINIDESVFGGLPQPGSWSAADRNKYYGTGSHGFNYSDNKRGDYSIKDPSLVFISHLKKAFVENGIELEDNPINEGRRIQLFDHVSSPLDEIMRSCMMRSDNMFAESMLRTYGKLEGEDGSTEQSAFREMLLWDKMSMPMNGVKIEDGSGLSRSNRVTANFMSEMLREMSRDATYASFFPLAGQEGTLIKFLAGTELDSYIAMKTGSMTGIQCYAGYKLDDNYAPTHVVVIMMNNIPKDRTIVKKAAENMLLKIFIGEK